LKELLPDPVDQAVEDHLKKLEACVSELEGMRERHDPEISEKAFAKMLSHP